MKASKLLSETMVLLGWGGGIVQKRPSLQTEICGLFKELHNETSCANRCGILFVMNGGGYSMETADGVWRYFRIITRRTAELEQSFPTQRSLY